jgi:hypothetical protein
MALVESLTGGVATIATDKFHIPCQIPALPPHHTEHVFGQARAITESFAIVHRDGANLWAVLRWGMVNFARASADSMYFLACHNALLLPPIGPT